MKQIQIGRSSIQSSAIVQGCMRINQLSIGEVDTLIKTDLENGITFFDHADCYANGKCEELFGQVLASQPSLRDRIVLQSKCGILTGNLYYFDFSKKHIINAVNGSLKRLCVDSLDFVLLHRPDSLMEPSEVASAFDELQTSGKVKNFGVSNQKPMQIELLKTKIVQPLHINQLQFGVAHTGMVDSGFSVNTKFSESVDHDDSVLEYSRVHEMTIQCWSPFQYGMIEGVFFSNPRYAKLCDKLEKIGYNHNVSASAVAVAWILRHPANMQAILGSINVKRIADIASAGDVQLSREEWYEIYHAAGNTIP